MRPHRAITLVPAVAAAIALALYGSGCGASGTALDPVAQAADTTSHAGGAHIAVSIQVSGAGLAQPLTMNGQGFFNYHRQEGTLALEASGLPESAAATLPPGPLRIEEIFKSSTIYVGSTLFGGKLPGGARWVKLDIGRFAQAIGFNLAQLEAGQSNPAQFLQYLRALAGPPERVGGDVVRGVATTHYRARIDLSKVAAVLPSSAASQLRAALAKLSAQLGTSRIPVDVWVDGQHLVRRLQLALSLATGAEGASVSITMDLFDFGPTPSLQAPPASEVFDATQAAVGGLAGAGG
jgi:hypothetical protein